MPNTVIVGVQWGDEGKGKVIDVLAENFDLVVRYQGGPNAGHTVIVGDEKYVFHLLPTGILRPDKQCIIGNGVVISLEKLIAEIKEHQSRGLIIGANLLISDRAHLIMPYHTMLEMANESSRLKIGTTLTGVGPAYADKMYRVTGIRVGDLFERDPEIFAEKLVINLEQKGLILKDLQLKINKSQTLKEYREYAKQIEPYVTDTTQILFDAIKSKKNLLFEGAQGTLLDVDLGTYPYVTSSNATAGGACTGTGVGPTYIDEVTGVTKAYTTRVGRGPFPTEFPSEWASIIREKGAEFGATTGRPRRCGWLDSVAGRYAVRINGISQLAITKLDVLNDMETLKLCVGYKYNGEELYDFPSSTNVLEECEPIYEELKGWKTDISGAKKIEELPTNAKKYLDRISELFETKISLVSVGPRRDQTVLSV